MTISKNYIIEKTDIVQSVNNIFQDAIEKKASDIHIEPLESGMEIRYRIDGVLRVVLNNNLKLYEMILARIKVMALLETTGRPKPQEGKIKINTGDKEVDLRVSIFPTSHGEAVVIRILESIKSYVKYTDLGLSQEQADTVEQMVKKPYGLILVTGPNGHGKSTTLFTILDKLNQPEKSLVTLEDPVEREINMVRQTQVDPEIDLSFASGLRFLLRQDPDIIMVGEIRDKETAQITVQAAVTGHLVLATVHTNDAAGAIVRLINMEVEPFLLASALKLVTAQRLARILCPDCREEFKPTEEIIARYKLPSTMKFYTSRGCKNCDHKGTRGRIGLHEVLVVSREIQKLIFTRPSDEQISQIAIREGMKTLKQMAMEKVNQGVISLEEALRLTD